MAKTQKTYAVHYGNGHLAKCQVMATDFRTLESAQKSAKAKAAAGYEIVIVADTDGNEWPIAMPPHERLT